MNAEKLRRMLDLLEKVHMDSSSFNPTLYELITMCSKELSEMDVESIRKDLCLSRRLLANARFRTEVLNKKQDDCQKTIESIQQELFLAREKAKACEREQLLNDDQIVKQINRGRDLEKKLKKLLERNFLS